jgi:pimeloyl-ACP methyl ester carboxylesterase
MKVVGWAVLYMSVGLVVVSTAAWYLQGYLIYHPRPYAPVVLAALPPRLVEIAYDTAQGPQVAFYLPPHDSPTHAPKGLWVLFHGNGSLALEWLEHRLPGLKTHMGFLLIDYPGYGKCTGRSSRDAIIASFEAALHTLQQRYPAARHAVERSLNVLGYSLGAAVALELAIRYPTQHIVLLAPFTSMYDIASHMVVWPITALLRERFDNLQALTTLAQRPVPPAVTIVHGDADEVVPVAMGRALAQSFPAMITYHELPGVTHSILERAAPLLAQAIAGHAE